MDRINRITTRNISHEVGNLVRVVGMVQTSQPGAVEMQICGPDNGTLFRVDFADKSETYASETFLEVVADLQQVDGQLIFKQNPEWATISFQKILSLIQNFMQK